MGTPLLKQLFASNAVSVCHTAVHAVAQQARHGWVSAIDAVTDPLQRMILISRLMTNNAEDNLYTPATASAPVDPHLRRRF